MPMHQVSRRARHVFGPVDSRRLGRSLGIDLLPHKTCSLDCIYCECGRTTDLRVVEDEFCPTSDVIREIDRALAEVGPVDSVTFSGSGEPLLHPGVGEILEHMASRHPGTRTTVLTNGTQLVDPAVRKRVLLAHRVVPSLDSATRAGFQAICRPHPSVDVEAVVEGIAALRREYRGELHLEAFLVPGVNDTPEELHALREAALRIEPDLVELNRLDRPGTLRLSAPDDDRMLEIANFLSPLPVSWPSLRPAPAVDSLDPLLPLLASRPGATIADLASATGDRAGDVAKHLRVLVSRGLAREEEGTGSAPSRFSALRR